jgi:hypothetical protein
MKNKQTARKMKTSLTLFSGAALIGIFASSCTDKKKSTAASPQPEKPKVETANPPAPPAPVVPAPNTSDGTVTGGGGTTTGTSPTTPSTGGDGQQPFVTTETIAPPQTAPVSGQTVVPQAVANELAGLASTFRPPYGPTEASTYQKTAFEERLISCVNQWLEQTKIQVAGDKMTFTSSVDVNECVKGVTVANIGNFTFNHNIKLRCEGKDLSELNDKFMTDAAFALNFCKDGSGGEFLYNVVIEAKETDKNNQVVRVYKRTKAITSKTGGTCAFTNSADGVRTWNECVWLDRIDGKDGVIHYANFTTKSGAQSTFKDKGFAFKSGQADVVLDDYKGSFTFAEPEAQLSVNKGTATNSLTAKVVFPYASAASSTSNTQQQSSATQK